MSSHSAQFWCGKNISNYLMNKTFLISFCCCFIQNESSNFRNFPTKISIWFLEYVSTINKISVNYNFCKSMYSINSRSFVIVVFKDFYLYVYCFTMISKNIKSVIEPQIKVSFYHNKENKSCKGADKSRHCHSRKWWNIIACWKNNRRDESFMFIVERYFTQFKDIVKVE